MASTTQTTVNSDNLIQTMQNLAFGAIGNLTTFGELLPELWALAPWQDTDTEIGQFMQDAFGIGKSDDGYVTLPQRALDAALSAFVADGVKLTYAQITALTGASRATAARAAARVGMSDSQPQKSPKKDETDTTDVSFTAGKSDKSDESDTDEFDLPALLSALSDSELKSVLSAVGLDRVRKLVK